MITLAINTYYHYKCKESEFNATIVDSVASELLKQKNTEIKQSLITAARMSVPEEAQDCVARALNEADKDTLKRYILVNPKIVECDGFLSPEEDRAQTTLKYITPFKFNVSRFYEDVREDGETKEFTFGVLYQSYGKKTVSVPVSIKTKDEAMAWVREHWDEISLPSDAEYVPGSDEPVFDEDCELEGC